MCIRDSQATRLLYFGTLVFGKEYPATQNRVKCVLPKLYIVHVSPETFLGPIIAVPYNIETLMTNLSWLFVEPTCNWDGIYSECMQDLFSE